MKALALLVLALVACAPPPAKVGPIATRAQLVPTETLLALIERSTKVTYKVTYDVTGVGGNQVLRGRWVIYQRPPDLRVDMAQAVGNATSETRTWAVGDTVTVCASPADCRSTARASAEAVGAGAQLDAVIRERPYDFEVSRAEDQQAAARTAFCYRIVPKPGVRAEFVDADLCYGADDIPLVVRLVSGDGEVRFRAVSVSDRVEPEEMRPPGR